MLLAACVTLIAGSAQAQKPIRIGYPVILKPIDGQSSHGVRKIDDETPALHEQEQRATELNTTLEMQDYARDDRVALKRLDADLAALGYSPERASAAAATGRTNPVCHPALVAREPSGPVCRRASGGFQACAT